MKLYTEESVIKLTRAAYAAGNNHNKFIFEIEFKNVPSIELPTDEEISKESRDKTENIPAFINGAKWMRDKIKKQNL